MAAYRGVMASVQRANSDFPANPRDDRHQRKRHQWSRGETLDDHGREMLADSQTECMVTPLEDGVVARDPRVRDVESARLLPP